MKKIFTLITVILITGNLIAQDIHFSQFNNSPLSLNPALAGAFNADHRIIANYKSQWRSIAHSYMTYGLSYDMGILKGKLNGGILGLGVQLYNDQAGANKMGLIQANVSIAYHLPVNRHNSLTAGIQGGFGQRRIDQSKMQWDNQYDPNTTDGYNSSLPSGETMGFKSKMYGDISAGMLWSYNSQTGTLSSNDARKITVGLAVFHINRPKQSFSDLVDSRLYMKIALHVNSFIGFQNSNFAILPSAVWYNQGPSNYILFGSLFRYRLNDASKFTNFVSETAISLGCHYRWSDAVVISGQFEWKNFMLGISYDVNVSQLATASKGAGGLEVALRYITPLFNMKNKSQY
ncbi:MAG: PorP/SprF family type IX secretion system membrane protein [Bacteroidota bacterium]